MAKGTWSEERAPAVPVSSSSRCPQVELAQAANEHVLHRHPQGTQRGLSHTGWEQLLPQPKIQACPSASAGVTFPSHRRRGHQMCRHSKPLPQDGDTVKRKHSFPMGKCFSTFDAGIKRMHPDGPKIRQHSRLPLARVP